MSDVIMRMERVGGVLCRILTPCDTVQRDKTFMHILQFAINISFASTVLATRVFGKHRLNCEKPERKPDVSGYKHNCQS